ncbi:GumC family protein [Pedobacter antarcticus]|uniref:GumC family protein n=1 Tax=Pedobacter antarcticus TaxID=34086 RepID=UPI00088414E0|nr:tyrosine-protein kinase [Pedobacter antarcticus]SDM17429.1 capsular exopolysaccharide family [Pedobacter antarcticus]
MNILNSSVSKDEEMTQEETINLNEILSKYLYHWPVFVLGLILTLTIAFLYLRYTKPIYEITTTLLIKDEKKGAPTQDILNQLDLFGGSKVVENEIEILKSKTLMAEVVKRENLNVNFRSEGRIVSSDIYSARPVLFQTLDMKKEYFGKEFNLSFPKDDQYTLEDVENNIKITGALNQLQINKLGTYKLDKTAYFNKQKNRKFTVSFINPDVVVANCLANLNITIVTKQSTVLKLTFQSTVPEKGKDILNTLIQVYNAAALSDKNRTTQSTIQFIDERLKLITGELVEVEKDVEGFKSSQGLTDITSEAQSYLENVKANDAKLSEVNLQLGVIYGIQSYVNSESSQEKLPSTLGINDPVILGQITQLGELQLKKINLLATTQPGNPVFESVNQQIESTRAGIKANIQNIKASLQNTKSELTAYNNQYEGSIRKIPGQERKFISIKRQQGIKESLYLYLLQKKEEAALSYASSVADSRVIDVAFSPDTPVKPKRSLTYLAALVLGILIPVGYIYIRELINNKIITASDISKYTSVPLLGELVFHDGKDAIVVQVGKRTAIAEQFRAIRTNLQYIQGKRNSGQGKITLLTSSTSGEGKSFVGTNIAFALALGGKKTVLLELDLRKPKVSKYLDLNNKIGLSNYLIGRAEIKDIIQPSGINENLMVIGSGPIPPNPSELFLGGEIEELFAYLRHNFDEIIVDTPPVGLVTDAQILARLVDATIYIVRYGVTFKQQIRSIEKLNATGKFPKMNVVFNGVQQGGSYGYGYGYGYYSDDITRKGIKLSFRELFKRF